LDDHGESVIVVESFYRRSNSGQFERGADASHFFAVPLEAAPDEPLPLQPGRVFRLGSRDRRANEVARAEDESFN
jgi:hypothetical protein